MDGCYCADPALSNAIVDALRFYGLNPDPAAVRRRPPPADTLAEQLRRIDLGGKVLALVRRRVPVGGDDRRLIERLVDSSCSRLEAPPAPPSTRTPTTAAVLAYAAKGGGTIGSFERFRRTFSSDADLLEAAPAAPPVDLAADRQDVRPMPDTNPRGRKPPPGTAAPATTNPTRTIRSSRWTAGGKAARS
jgi:hypothetical protein